MKNPRFTRLLMALMLLLPATSAQADLISWWLTPDQQGQRLLEQGQPAAAAQRFTQPERIGAALFEAGDFEGAAAVFGRMTGPEGAYNRGNALIMLGQYEEAIDSYDAALAERPDWRAAQENRAIAVARQAALAPPEDDAGGTGGMLGADEIVMDDSGRVSEAGTETVIEAGEAASDEQALQALWLRRVDTEPGRFLSAKFAAQLASDSGATGSESAAPAAAQGDSEDTDE